MAIGHLIATWGAAAFAAVLALPAGAAEIRVAAGAAELQAVIDRSADDDTVLLAAGEHRGPLRLGHRLTLAGEPGATVIGSGVGSVITVAAPGAIVRGLTIRGSGTDLPAMDAGVFVEQSAAGALVEHNVLDGNLYGIYLHGAPDSIARANRINGIRYGRMNEAGNGVSVWNAPGAKVIDNDISYGRDGLFSISSRKNTYSGNRFHDVRFAVHYMYTNDSVISDNVSIGNTVGYAIMFSNHLKVSGNISDHDRDRGFLFNFANGSEITGNAVFGGLQPAERWVTTGIRIEDPADAAMVAADEPARALAASAGARVGPEKCVFIYNANQNRFRANWFEGCEIGIHFTAGSEVNEIVGNAFVHNVSQVKYVGGRNMDWSKGGRGNYWSDNPGFDLNGDGLADTAYRPNDLMDKVMWTNPQAKVLANSPSVQVIRWAQAQFPALLPGGVIDSHPLIAPPKKPVAAAGALP